MANAISWLPKAFNLPLLNQWKSSHLFPLFFHFWVPDFINQGGKNVLSNCCGQQNYVNAQQHKEGEKCRDLSVEVFNQQLLKCCAAFCVQVPFYFWMGIPTCAQFSSLQSSISKIVCATVLWGICRCLPHHKYARPWSGDTHCLQSSNTSPGVESEPLTQKESSVTYAITYHCGQERVCVQNSRCTFYFI